MNSIQRKYAIAKATYETISDAYTLEIEKFDHLLDEERFDEHDKIDDKIDERLGMNEARNTLVDAENALIDWSEKTMKKEFPGKTEELKPVYEAARKHHYKFRDKVIDLAFRLKA
jgi:hypothetical protein